MTGKGRGSHSGRWRGGRRRKEIRRSGWDERHKAASRSAPHPKGRAVFPHPAFRGRFHRGAGTRRCCEPCSAWDFERSLHPVALALSNPVAVSFTRPPQCPAFIPHRFDCPLNPHDDAGLRPLQLHSPLRERRGSRLSYLFYLFYLKAHSMRLTVVATGSFRLCRAFGFRLAASSLSQLSVVNNPIRSAGLSSACHPAAASIAHTRFPKRATIPRMPSPPRPAKA